jgi:hypothetical protein
VTLSIKRAERHRSLAREWWFGRNELIEVYLSEAQFVELMARPNMGDGVPCTLAYVAGERMPNPPVEETLKAKYRADMQADATRCVSELKAAHKELVEAIESGKIGKTALKEIAKKIEYAGYAVSNGIPFVQQSFEEKMEAVTHHAAAEIEATVTNMAIRLGIERMQEIAAGAPKMLDGETKAPKVQAAVEANPLCDECREPMSRYTDPATGRDGWGCDTCGWSEDDSPEA